MQLTRVISLLAIGLLAGLVASPIAGCASRHPEQDPNYDLTLRYQAATRIENLQARDEAFAQVASDAAARGDGPRTREAVGQIAAPEKRDGTAAHCAQRLAREKQWAMATDLASLIVSPALRDDTLKELASGG